MTGIYQSIYDIILNSVFGGTIENTVYGSLICEGFSAFACCFLLALPFVLVWRFVRVFL